MGRDRRSGPSADADAGVGVLGLVSALLAALWLGGLVVVASGATLPAGIDEGGLTALLEATAAALGAVVTVVAFVRWRLIGEARIVWLGVGVLFLGPVAAGLGGLIPAVVAGPTPSLVESVLVPVAHLVGIGALAAAAAVPEVDTRVRPRTALGIATAAALTISLVFWLASDLAAAVTTTSGHALLGMAWCAVALLHARAARRNRRRHSVAVVVAASGLAFAAATRAVAVDVTVPFEAAPYVFLVIALSVLFAQGVRDLETAFCIQREQLLDRQVDVETEQVRRRAEENGDGRRRHDARNALMAIQGATYVLDNHGDRIDEDRREQLAGAVAGEMEHLRKLIETSHDPAPFPVAQVVNDVIESEAAPEQVHADVDEGIVAVGRTLDTAEVVRRLIRNARNRAPGAPVTVRSERDGGWAVLYVEDRGGGVARSDRDAVLDGPSGDTGNDGLGLFVCRRLMVDQGGDAWVENRPGGGATFALCLPLSPSEVEGEAPVAPEVERPGVDGHDAEVHDREGRAEVSAR